MHNHNITFVAVMQQSQPYVHQTTVRTDGIFGYLQQGSYTEGNPLSRFRQLSQVLSPFNIHHLHLGEFNLHPSIVDHRHNQSLINVIETSYLMLRVKDDSPILRCVASCLGRCY